MSHRGVARWSSGRTLARPCLSRLATALSTLVDRGLPPALCDKSGPTDRKLSYALRGTPGGLYVMLQGSVTEAELAASKLKGFGLSVARLGRYLGEAIADFDADWFLRLMADPTKEVEAKIALALGGPPALRDERGLRERLLAAELERALARDAEAKAALSRLTAVQDEAALLGEAAAQAVPRLMPSVSRGKSLKHMQIRRSNASSNWRLSARPFVAPARRSEKRSRMSLTSYWKSCFPE